MAPPYSHGNGYVPPSVSASSSYDQRPHTQPRPRPLADDDDILAGARRLLARFLAYCNGPGRVTAWKLTMRVAHQVKLNLAARRLLSFPHLLVAVWVLVLLWGERWIFATKVNSCDWDHWEKWPEGATPHHLIFVADPQITDPHSYPGRPWPLNPLTILITDNYLRRSYTALQRELQPDTVFFLGDLFDGGREWKTASGNFEDPAWAKGRRPPMEQKYVQKWHKSYGQDYWLSEFARFGDIFYNNRGWDVMPGAGQRGVKVISSLPGNHDLGFGSDIKIPVRQRFETYFGDANRVDVIGNHTFVSVDTVSLSAGDTKQRELDMVKDVYEPVEDFLKDVKRTKRRAVARELKFWRGESEDLVFQHKVDDDLVDAEFANLPTLDPGENAPDLPTVLLTHVPLYRDPGTPCGPMREHWPPSKPPKGETAPVFPDDRNAISVSGGYQYQNVLSGDDSVKLIKSIGHVVHAFSGDDHDYCEVIHSDEQENVREITVKSLSMAMGVPTPGFQMVSLYNPIDENGVSMLEDGYTTLQTHLCLLPTSFSTYATYVALAIVSLVVLVARALLVPVLNLQPFALNPVRQVDPVLPLYKAKVDDEEHGHDLGSSSSGNSTSKFLSSRISRATRDRSHSLTSNGSYRSISPRSKHRARAGQWGWGDSGRGPRIEIRRDLSNWRAATRTNWRASLQSRTSVVGREIWTTCWRVAWMVVGFFAYLAWKG